MGKLRDFRHNVSYSLFANIINLIVSTLTSLLIPILFKENAEGYGYYQIYIFYVSFVGFFHLGLCDGFLLRNAGKDIETINTSQTSFEFWVLTFFEFIIGPFIVLYFIFFGEKDYLYISIAFALNLVIFLPRNYLSNLLQSVNKHKQNAFITIIGRGVFLILVTILIVLKKENYLYFVGADIVGKTFALLYGFFACRKLVTKRIEFKKENFTELSDDIRAGSKIMLAGISSLVITGIVKIVIQNVWDVETYGKISLILTIANLVLSFVTAVSIVLFPSLKTVERDRQIALYPNLKNTLLPFIMATIFLSYPCYLILSYVLPQYAEGIKYIAYMFPICFFSAKATLIVQTYLQINRMENKILLSNVISIFISTALSVVFLLLLKDLSLALPIILISQIVRCFTSEFFLKKNLNLKFLKDIVIEISIITIYIIVFVIWGDLISFIVFFGLFAVYFILKKKDIFNSFKFMVNLIKKDS